MKKTNIGTVTISISEFETLLKSKDIVKSILRNYQIIKNEKGNIIAEGFVLDQKMLAYYFPEECEAEIYKVRGRENV